MSDTPDDAGGGWACYRGAGQDPMLLAQVRIAARERAAADLLRHAEQLLGGDAAGAALLAWLREYRAELYRLLPRLAPTVIDLACLYAPELVEALAPAIGELVGGLLAQRGGTP